MRCCVRRRGFVVLVVATLGLARGFADAQAPLPASVWFRSAVGCPDGDAFMRALSARDVAARLAQVGDPIDFVVTLGMGPDDRASGVLERQTQTGTVAIRRVDDPNCDQVADALALTLALAVQGGGESHGDDPAAEVAAAPGAVGAAAASPGSEPASATAPVPAVVAAPVGPTAAARAAPPADPPAAAHRSTQWSLGLSALAATGLAPDLVPGGSAFVELDWIDGRSLFRPALRISALAALGSGTEAGRDFELRILGGRIAGCPVALGAGALLARPCLALELGQIHGKGEGQGGRSEGGLWAASEASARLDVGVVAGFSLETEVGLLVPWTRYTLRAGDGAIVHRMAELGVAVRLGAVMHFL